MIPVGFKVKALVRQPSDELVESFRGTNQRIYRSANGTLVAWMNENRELSHATYPAEWRTGGVFEYQADFSGGIVHKLYNFPEQFAGTSYRLELEAPEAHARGAYCQVITGYSGERLRPYRRQGNPVQLDSYSHPTISVFSAHQLSTLRLDANQAHQTGALRIRQAKVEVADGLVTATINQLFELNDPSLATTKIASLPNELAEWQPALLAHYERWECEAIVRCDGHYHLD